MKWMRKCDGCGHQQEDKKPSDIRELTDAYRERKCKACKSASLEYGRDVQEAHEVYAEHPVCDECGKLEFAVANGYAFGDRLLEGVRFVIRLSADGVVTAETPASDKRYMADLNEAKWLKEAAKFAAETDTLECPQCGGDIDGFSVIGAPVRVEA